MADSPVGDRWVRGEAEQLLRLAGRVQPEGEGLDLTDQEYAMEDMAGLRSYLSSMRKNIDIINAALAVAWDEEFGGKDYDDGTNDWKVGRTKGKKLVDADAFYGWMATLDADRLARLVSVASIKVGGMNESERQNFLDESPYNDKLTLKFKPHYR